VNARLVPFCGEAAVGKASGYRVTHFGEDKAREYDADLWDLGAAKGLTWAMEQRLLGRILDAFPARTALDFACGTGRVLGFLTHRGLDVTGVDISPDMLAVAHTHWPGAHLVAGDVTVTPDLLTGEFDLATAFRFFLNAEPDLRADAVRWLHGVVRPGGRLVANFHLNPYSARGLYTRARQGRAQRTMSVAQAKALLAAGGFRPLSVHGYDVLPFRRDGNPLALPRLRAAVESALLDRRGIEHVAATFVVVAERV
jgi:SAM-dependent methyltransferase